MRYIRVLSDGRLGRITTYAGEGMVEVRFPDGSILSAGKRSVVDATPEEKAVTVAAFKAAKEHRDFVRANRLPSIHA